MEHGVTGYLFESAQGLCTIWRSALARSSDDDHSGGSRYTPGSTLAALAANVQKDRVAWEDNWARVVVPLVARCTEQAL